MAGVLFQHVGVGAPYVVGAGITAAALALVLTMHEQPTPATVPSGIGHSGAT